MGSFFGNGCYGVKAQNTARWWHDPLWGAQLFKFCVWSLATLMSVWEGWTNLFDLGIVEGESTDHKLVLGFVFYRDGAVVVQLKYFSAGKGKKAHDSFQDAAFIYIYIYNIHLHRTKVSIRYYLNTSAHFFSSVSLYWSRISNNRSKSLFTEKP